MLVCAKLFLIAEIGEIFLKVKSREVPRKGAKAPEKRKKNSGLKPGNFFAENPELKLRAIKIFH